MTSRLASHGLNIIEDYSESFGCHFPGGIGIKESAYNAGDPGSIPGFSPEKSHGWKRLAGCSPWGHKEMDRTERLHFLWLAWDFQCKGRNSRKFLLLANMMNLRQKNIGSMGTHFLNFPRRVQSTDHSSLEHKNFISLAFENQSWGKESSQLFYTWIFFFYEYSIDLLFYTWILNIAELYCTYYL